MDEKIRKLHQKHKSQAIATEMNEGVTDEVSSPQIRSNLEEDPSVIRVHTQSILEVASPSRLPYDEGSRRPSNTSLLQLEEGIHD